jgi:hypothetical protein
MPHCSSHVLINSFTALTARPIVALKQIQSNLSQLASAIKLFTVVINFAIPKADVTVSILVDITLRYKILTKIHKNCLRKN